MGHFAASIESTSDVAETLRVLRLYSAEPLSRVRSKLGTDEIALDVSESDYPTDMDMEAGLQHQHALFRRACEELRNAGAEIQLWYSPDRFELRNREKVTDEILMNLMAAHREYLLQEHD